MKTIASPPLALLLASLLALPIVGCAGDHSNAIHDDDDDAVPVRDTDLDPSRDTEYTSSIVIKGSRDSTRPDDRTETAFPTRERTNPDQIAALTSQAIASQGRDNGTPIQGKPVHRTSADVKNDILQNRNAIAENSIERQKLYDNERYYAYPDRPNIPNPQSLAALDEQLERLKTEQAALMSELASLEQREERAGEKPILTPGQ